MRDADDVETDRNPRRATQAQTPQRWAQRLFANGPPISVHPLWRTLPPWYVIPLADLTIIHVKADAEVSHIEKALNRPFGWVGIVNGGPTSIVSRLIGLATFVRAGRPLCLRDYEDAIEAGFAGERVMLIELPRRA
jgi:hypothetical protein